MNQTDRPFPDRRNPEPGEPTPIGGYYTQEDMKEIIRYAAGRCIEIIPEIDMPGHSNAALAAYPELACPSVDKHICVVPGMGQGSGNIIFCAGNEEAFRFLEGVIDEVAELFPSHYIHLGGDEAWKEYWKKCPRCADRMKQIPPTERRLIVQPVNAAETRTVPALPLQRGTENIPVSIGFRTDDQNIAVPFLLHVRKNRINPQFQRRKQRDEIIRLQLRQFFGTDRQRRNQRQPVKLRQSAGGRNIAGTERTDHCGNRGIVAELLNRHTIFRQSLHIIPAANLQFPAVDSAVLIEQFRRQTHPLHRFHRGTVCGIIRRSELQNRRFPHGFFPHPFIPRTVTTVDKRAELEHAKRIQQKAYTDNGKQTDNTILHKRSFLSVSCRSVRRRNNPSSAASCS